MAFSVSGATLFSMLSSTEVDQRSGLGGYRPLDLLLGRLFFLGPLGLCIGAAFSVLMATVSSPVRPWLTFVGVAAVALESIAYGLAVGAAVPRELEGTLILSSLSPQGPIEWPVLLTFVYGLALMILARLLMTGRVEVTRHSEIR